MCPDRPLVGCCCIARAAAVAVSAAAQAQEALGTARAEVRGGIAWTAGEEEAVAGAAIGYDFDLGDSALIGVEGFADHLLADGADFVWGLGARAGIRVSDAGRLYAAGGYPFGDGEDTPYLGAGYNHRLGQSVYVSAEYRHFFSDFLVVNAATVGVGFNF